MALKFYFDHHVPRAITLGLRLRNIDILTAYEDGTHELSDPQLLEQATALGRVLFTQDDDLLVEATRRQQEGMNFAGVIYAHQRAVSIGQCVLDLYLIAEIGNEDDIRNNVIYLPL